MRGLAFFLLFLAFSSFAWAHRINIFAYVKGRQIVGQVYFSDGSPARGVKVQLFSPVGELLASTSTDAQGRFSFALPEHDQVRMVALGQMGHRAEMSLKLRPGSQNKPTRGGGTGLMSERPSPSAVCATADWVRLVHEEVEQEVLPLRSLLEQILKEVKKPSWGDVFSGLGYILGLSGWLLWFKTRKS